MSYTIVRALKEQGKQRRDLGCVELARLRRRLRRQHAVRVWTRRILVTIGYVGLTGIVVALLMGV